MHSDDYNRLHEACLVMARQPDVPDDVQARWLVMAKASFTLANEVDKKRRSVRLRQN
jgi:hypothetical protein